MGIQDLAIFWDNAEGVGDLETYNADFVIEETIVTPILLSLFVNARATEDQAPPGEIDLNGHWADQFYNDTLSGSLLWTLRRGKRTQETLNAAKQYAEQSLEWIVQDGLAGEIVVPDPTWTAEGLLNLRIEAVEPVGTPGRYRFKPALRREQTPITIRLVDAFGGIVLTIE